LKGVPAKRCALALLVLAASTAAAAPPAFPFADGLAKPTLQARPGTVLHLGSLAIEFEKTSMLEVLRSVGTGEIHSQGDAGDSLSWICYQVADAAAKDKSAQLLWITSGALQGGQIADGVVAHSVPAAPSPGDCAPLPERFRPVRIDGGLWLGSSRAELDLALPQISAERSGWLEYIYSGKYRDVFQQSDRGNVNTVEYEEVSSVVLRLVDGRVAELYSNKTTTY
jgi:hypothetical protein